MSWPVGQPIAPPPKRSFGAVRWVMVGVMIASSCAALYCVASLGRDVLHALSQPAVTGPATFNRQLSPGRYYVYERSALYGSTLDSTGTYRVTQLVPDDVVVTGPGGQNLTVWYVSGTVTESHNGRSYHAVVQFQVTDPGTHTIQLRRVNDSFVVSRDPFDGQGSKVGLLLLSGAAGGVALIALIVVTVTRNRRQNPAWPVPPAGIGAAAPPPGWGPPGHASPPPGWGSGAGWPAAPPPSWPPPPPPPPPPPGPGSSF